MGDPSSSSCKLVDIIRFTQRYDALPPTAKALVEGRLYQQVAAAGFVLSANLSEETGLADFDRTFQERLTVTKSKARDRATGKFVSPAEVEKRPRGRPKGSKQKVVLEQLPEQEPRRPARRTKKASSAKKDGLERAKNLFELSVTISTGGQDIDASLLDGIQKFLVEQAISGKCSVERGGAAYHLHLQMVVRILAVSVIAVSKLIKAYLGWSKSQPAGASVMCKKLTNKGMHTFQGMIAYCMKDADKEHYATVDHNIQPADVQRGVEVYSLFGKEENKNRVALSMTNIVDKVSRWRKYNCKHPLVIDFEADLYEMIKTGKYYPMTSWVVGGSGRGYEPFRMQSLYRMVVSPDTVTRTDVASVFHSSSLLKQAQASRRVWFAGRFQPDEEDIASKKDFAGSVSYKDVQDMEGAHEEAKTEFFTAEHLSVSEILVHTRSGKNEGCSETGKGPPAPEPATGRKRKVRGSPTRHLWPPEWNIDDLESSLSESSAASMKESGCMPEYIPLCEKSELPVCIE